MKSRHLALAAVAAAALLPSISAAAGDRDAAKACARAFAASIAAPGALPQNYKLSFRDPPNPSMLTPYGRFATFNLKAQNAKTGVILARAVCSTSSGSVTDLSAVPLDGTTAYSDTL